MIRSKASILALALAAAATLGACNRQPSPDDARARDLQTALTAQRFQPYGASPQELGLPPQGPQGYAPQGYAPQGYAPQGYYPQPGYYAPQGYVPQGYYPYPPQPVAYYPAPQPAYYPQPAPAAAPQVQSYPAAARTTTRARASSGGSGTVARAPQKVKHTGRDAAIGAGVGAISGAVIGRNVTGAVIGAAAGGVLGAVVGSTIDVEHR